MTIPKKSDKNTWVKIDTGGENFTFTPSVSQDFISISLKNKIATSLISGYNNYDNSIIVETFSQAQGYNGLINTTNTLADYSFNKQGYAYHSGSSGSSGLIETELLISTSKEIKQLLVSEIFDNATPTDRSRIEISLNAGLNYAFDDPNNYKYTDELVYAHNLPYSSTGDKYQVKLKLFLNPSLTVPLDVNTWSLANEGVKGYRSIYKDPALIYTARSNYNLLWSDTNQALNAGRADRSVQDTNLITGVVSSLPQAIIGQVGGYSTGFVGRDYCQMQVCSGFGSTTVGYFKRFTYISSTWSTEPTAQSIGATNYNSMIGLAGGQSNGILYKGLNKHSRDGTIGNGSITSFTNYSASLAYYNTQPPPAADNYIANNAYNLDSAYKFSNGVWSTLIPANESAQNSTNTHTSSISDIWISNYYAIGNSNINDLKYNNGISWTNKSPNPVLIAQYEKMSTWLTGSPSTLWAGMRNTNFYQGDYTAFYNYNKLVDIWANMGDINFPLNTEDQGPVFQGAEHQMCYTPGNLWISNSGWNSHSSIYVNSGAKYTFSSHAGLKGIGIKLIYK